MFACLVVFLLSQNMTITSTGPPGINGKKTTTSATHRSVLWSELRYRSMQHVHACVCAHGFVTRGLWLHLVSLQAVSARSGDYHLEVSRV